VTGSPTYRELVERANEDVERAAVELAAAPLTGRRAAGEAVAAYRALLGAIHAHAKALIIHVDGMADVAAAAPDDSCDAAAAQIVRGLIRFGYLPGRIRYELEGPAKAWAAAKASLDAATDLLTSHRDLDGVMRTSDALQRQDFAPRANALTHIGDLTFAVVEAEKELSERASESGMAHGDLERLLPDLTPLQRKLHALTGLANE
jgi:hypothetical protein